MEGIISLVSFNPLNLKSKLRFGLLRNPSIDRTKHCLRNDYKLNFKYLGTRSPILAGASQITIISVTDKVSDRIDSLVTQVKGIFESMNDGEMSPSAYDTAWVARIPSINDSTKLQFPTTLNWILKNQHEDGSWGEPSFFLLYDRLVCTLSCVLALHTWSTGQLHIQKGLIFLREHIEQLGNETTSLRTSGFEIVFPSMLQEARNVDFDLPYDMPCLKEIFSLRERKLKRIPHEVMHSTHTTMLYSLEAMQEKVEWRRILKLQSKDGSFLSSISATAVAYMHTGNAKCLEFLTNVIRRFGDHAPCHYPVDLQERIWAVDTIQRLGIDHHFQEEISQTLGYVYRNITANGVSWGRDNPIPDIDDTCMALRLLRLHGIPVPSDGIKHFKDGNGEFICFPGETHRGVSDMFNLHRFSQISFPGETILEEAKSFVEKYLTNCYKNNTMEDKWSLKKALHKEVSHALTHPWKMSLQRLDVREYINHFGESDVWIAKTLLRMYNVNNPIYLELAKLDYNMLQAMHKSESNSIVRWWNTHKIDDHFVTKKCPQEMHFSVAATIFEPEFAECRIAYTKLNSIEDILEDIFHNHGSIEDLNLLCQAVEEWNPVHLLKLPVKIRIILKMIYDTSNELATQASIAQEKDVFHYLHLLRLNQIKLYLKNRKIRERKGVVSMKESIENGKEDCGVASRVIPAMLLMGVKLEDSHLQSLDNQSKFHNQLSLHLRLLIDVAANENTMPMKTTSLVCSCMIEEKCTEEEAVKHLKRMAEEAFHELVYEYLKPSQVPRCCRRLLFEHGRVTRFFLDMASTPQLYKERIRNEMERLFSSV